ncbi:hypothetical protein EVAR_9651_1 [Eumeta japonica]|uniref:Uncharacterized protein n=1 Tax=Eumeta variegata TaxID=151549 RepID=A0A4C1TMC0_EUMVA|nr:hypothetical protein EVAR_9651_1 [Eumeta japonica]
MRKPISIGWLFVFRELKPDSSPKSPGDRRPSATRGRVLEALDHCRAAGECPMGVISRRQRHITGSQVSARFARNPGAVSAHSCWDDGA